MIPNKDYFIQDRIFWSHIKFLSEKLGYSSRGDSKMRTYSNQEILTTMRGSGLRTAHLLRSSIKGEKYLNKIVNYLNFRSRLLEEYVAPNLMNREQAKKTFEQLRKEIKPKCKLPMNKQKGVKKHYAYLTGIVNMLTEKSLGTCTAFEQDPRSLTIFTESGKPLRTFTRRFDGAYPGVINPKAIWEIKEYYGTTTFGSRVADGLYETLLDGEELLELENNLRIKVLHYLIVDDRFTWWEKGKSYLCRIIDMLHAGYLTEALFGKEVLTRWPLIVKSWTKQ